MRVARRRVGARRSRTDTDDEADEIEREEGKEDDVALGKREGKKR